MLKKVTKMEIAKAVYEADGLREVVANPRIWSPNKLQEACHNITLSSDAEVYAIERATLEFLFKHFFFMQHQTGLYNLQRKVWHSIANAKKIKMKRLEPMFDKSKYLISDIKLEDSSTGKFILARLVHPDSKADFPRFDDLTAFIPNKCLGVFYITAQNFSNKIISKIQKRTNHNDPIDKYRAPITHSCSINLINYRELEEGMEYSFQLVYPYLERLLESTLNFKG